MTYQTLMDEAQTLYQQAQQKQEDAEAMKREEIEIGGIEAWRGYHFDSSSGLTPEFASFAAKMRTHLKKTLAPDFSLVSYSRGHFYFSAFIKNTTTSNLAYIFCSDVRYSPDEWYTNLIIRTAEHDKDYTGGRNDSATLATLKEKALELTA